MQRTKKIEHILHQITLKMNQVLEFTYKDFKPAIITIISEVKENRFSVHENLSREMENLGRE